VSSDYSVLLSIGCKPIENGDIFLVSLQITLLAADAFIPETEVGTLPIYIGENATDKTANLVDLLKMNRQNSFVYYYSVQ
jgi:hypothetical protein